MEKFIFASSLQKVQPNTRAPYTVGTDKFSLFIRTMCLISLAFLYCYSFSMKINDPLGVTSRI